MRVSAQVKTNALKARAFLDYDDDGVNGFLVQASVACRILALRPKGGSAWRPHVTMERATKPWCFEGTPIDRSRVRAAAPTKLPPARVL